MFFEDLKKVNGGYSFRGVLTFLGRVVLYIVFMAFVPPKHTGQNPDQKYDHKSH